MSFDSLERSNFGSIEVQFYRFTRGSREWYYCNADQDVLMNGVQWSANPSSHDDVNLSGEALVDTVTLTVPNTFEPAQQFRGQSPADAVYLRIYACHAVSLYPMLVMDTDFAVRWIGTVSDVQQKDADRLSLIGSTLTSAFDREGVRLTWNRNCSYAVFDLDTCRVDKAAFATNVTISALTGNSITSPDIATKVDGWFDQGFIEIFVAEGVTQRIAIESHTGNTFTLLGTTENLLPGQQIIAYPGCSQTADICLNKFNNILNFSGYEGMSGTSPFNGNPVF